MDMKLRQEKKRLCFERAMKSIGNTDIDGYYHQLSPDFIPVAPSTPKKVKVECYVEPEKLPELIALVNGEI